MHTGAEYFTTFEVVQFPSYSEQDRWKGHQGRDERFGYHHCRRYA